jgi:hypothetical protein
MLGFKIISKKKLERMNNLNKSFRSIIKNKEAQIKSLENHVNNQNNLIAKYQMENYFIEEKLANAKEVWEL